MRTDCAYRWCLCKPQSCAVSTYTLTRYPPAHPCLGIAFRESSCRFQNQKADPFCLCLIHERLNIFNRALIPPTPALSLLALSSWPLPRVSSVLFSLPCLPVSQSDSARKLRKVVTVRKETDQCWILRCVGGSGSMIWRSVGAPPGLQISRAIHRLP